MYLRIDLLHYWIADKIWDIFKHGKLLNFENWCSGELSKLGIILIIKWFKNWCYQKMSITKNVLLNCYYSMKKEMRKILMIFDVWKSNFGTLWHVPTTPILTIQQFLLVILIFRQNFVFPDLKLHKWYCHLYKVLPKYLTYWLLG